MKLLLVLPLHSCWPVPRDIHKEETSETFLFGASLVEKVIYCEPTRPYDLKRLYELFAIIALVSGEADEV